MVVSSNPILICTYEQHFGNQTFAALMVNPNLQNFVHVKFSTYISKLNTNVN